MLGKNLILPARTITTLVPRPRPAQTYRLPFHLTGSVILFTAAINSFPAVLLFDTGATHTVVSLDLLGLSPHVPTFSQDPYHADYGDALQIPIALLLDRYELMRVSVLAGDLRDLNRRLRTQCDGIFGLDLISSFHSVRIDYQCNLLELEK